MVGGVPGPALWALLRRRGELNGSRGDEIVTDSAMKFVEHLGTGA